MEIPDALAGQTGTTGWPYFMHVGWDLSLPEETSGSRDVRWNVRVVCWTSTLQDHEPTATFTNTMTFVSEGQTRFHSNFGLGHLCCTVALTAQCVAL